MSNPHRRSWFTLVSKSCLLMYDTGTNALYIILLFKTSILYSFNWMKLMSQSFYSYSSMERLYASKHVVIPVSRQSRKKHIHTSNNHFSNALSLQNRKTIRFLDCKTSFTLFLLVEILKFYFTYKILLKYNHQTNSYCILSK